MRRFMEELAFDVMCVGGFLLVGFLAGVLFWQVYQPVDTTALRAANRLIQLP